MCADADVYQRLVFALHTPH